MSDNAFTNVQIYTGAPAPMAAQQNQVATDVTGSATDQQRAIAEVQASLLIAQSCPRNELRARDKLLVACQRLRLAEGAVYVYKRAGTEVKGPSIRLAEAAARYYGNLDYGFREVARRPGESEVEAYCWDKESNTRVSRLFTVKHLRDLKGGKTMALSAERDIYEAIASQAQRRVRSAILEIIPGDIIEDALDACDQTLKAAVPDLPKAIKAVLQTFAAMGVNQVMLETRMGRKAESFQAADIIALRRIWAGMKDGISQASDWFDMSLADRPQEAQAAPQQEQQPQEAPQQAAQSVQQAPEQTQPAPQQQEPAQQPEQPDIDTIANNIAANMQPHPQQEQPQSKRARKSKATPEPTPAQQAEAAAASNFRFLKDKVFWPTCVDAKVSPASVITAFREANGGSSEEAIIYLAQNDVPFRDYIQLVLDNPGKFAADLDEDF